MSKDLKKQIRFIFERKYQRKLKEDEVLEIAQNLTNFMEDFIKFKLKGNENDYPRP